MDLEKLKKQLIIDEGCVLEVYCCSLGFPTFGIGHLLTKNDPEYYAYNALKKGGKLKVSQERVDEVFKKDIEGVVRDCCRLFKSFNEMHCELQQILANMMFNLGFNKLSKFTNTIKAINNKDYELAASLLRSSLWFKQVGKRAERLCNRLENIK
jgi:lysozyme